MPPDDYRDAGRIRGSRQFEALPRIMPVVTFITIILCVVLFGMGIYAQQTASSQAMAPQALDTNMQALGFRNNAQILLGDWWGLISNVFFHGGMLHIFMNCLIVLRFGALIERGIGSLNTLFFILVTGFISSIWQLDVTAAIQLARPLEDFTGFVDSTRNPMHPITVLSLELRSAVGISGVAFAMAGFMLGAWPRWTGFLEGFDAHIVKFLVFWQLLCFGLTLTDVRPIANTAHIAGFLAGLFIGIWACKGNRFGWPWLGATIAMTAVGIAGFFYCSKKFALFISQFS